MKKSKTLSIYLIIMTMIFIITFSFLIPILFRPFFYWQISTLNLVKKTGFDYQTIKTAYDEIMNFCLGLSSTFSTGGLKYSVKGFNHFLEVRNLLGLNAFLLIFSTFSILIVPFLFKKINIIPYRFNGYSNSYYASSIVLISFITIFLLMLPDFTLALNIFHYIFFPGNKNWLFDYKKDEIILIFPEKFFLNYSVLIVLMMTAICLYLIYRDKKAYFSQRFFTFL